MPKRLNGYVNTGKKIMKNLSEFTYEYKYNEFVHDKTLYHFDWNFNDQSGSAAILLTANGEILHPF